MIPTDWPPHFQQHNRVIDLLVGPQLYTSTDAAVRELLQNAEDACTLMGPTDGYAPQIIVRFSPSENWCEFVDNGLGMNRESIQGSFAWIGAPKTEVRHIRERLAQMSVDQRQIAQFGIGILSCFGVASSVELHTKMDNEESIALRIVDYHEPFEELPAAPRERGTTIRLTLKSDAGMKAVDVPMV
jgi:molecular chaperone HtpG